jgi:hypothetical protein
MNGASTKILIIIIIVTAIIASSSTTAATIKAKDDQLSIVDTIIVSLVDLITIMAIIIL